ncbi:MAG: hypothetical protein KF771_06915 [Burkholderiales bacterium]|nr:hypothetical protein [Burkholderiales bacterium]
MELARKPICCPKCGSRPVARIVYGLPHFSEKEAREVDTGKIVLGGCIITDDDPQWACVSCGQQIFKTKK